MNSVRYSLMEKCSGVPLDDTVIDHTADKLLDVPKEIHSHPSKTLGSVGGPYNNRFMEPPHAFQSATVYLDYYRGMFLDIRRPGYVGPFSHFPADLQAHTRDNILPHNILLDASKIIAATRIDWETTGYYPEFSDPRRREKEIDVVSKSFFTPSTAV